jgi:hypothetical protein
MEDLAPGAVGWLGSTGGITEDGPKPARATPPATSPSWRYEIIASALELGGTVTGEHGVGLLKRDGLVAEITPAVLAMHHAVTAALDPYGISTPRQDLHHARAVTAPPLPTTRPYGVSFVSEGDLVPGPTPSFAAAPARRARRIGRLDRRNSPTPSASAGRPGGALRPGVAGGIESIPNRARRSTCRPIVRAAVAGVPGTG